MAEVDVEDKPEDVVQVESVQFGENLDKELEVDAGGPPNDDE